MPRPLRANQEDYALLETFEITGNPVVDHATYGVIEHLARRMDGDALVISGISIGSAPEEMAERVRLTVVE